MTTVIRKNQEWFEKKIMEAVADEISERIREEAARMIEIVVSHLVYTGYAEHMYDDTFQQDKLVIEIDLPDPKTCEDSLEKLETGIIYDSF